MTLQRKLDRLLARATHRLGIGPPKSNFLNGVGQLRYIQATREPEGRRNPDHAVGLLLSRLDRFRAEGADMSELRVNPFYQYLRFRTIHYDRLFEQFIDGGGRQIVIFGVGTDTRSLRFAEKIKANEVRVLETDLEPWASQRRKVMRKLGAGPLISQLSFDIASHDVSELIDRAGLDPAASTLFFAEGVLTYVAPGAAQAFLARLGKLMSSDSTLAYDAKRQGKNENGSFRLPDEVAGLKSLHAEAEIRVDHMVPSDELAEFLAESERNPKPRFDEDILLVLHSEGHEHMLRAS